MKKHHIFLFFSVFMMLGCNKPDPNPELRDVIYQDYRAELDLAKRSLESEKKTLAEHEESLAKIIPQTGQVKYARKRIEESKARISRFEQQVQYFELKSADRLKASQSSYLKAFNEGKAWPNQKEIDDYKALQKLKRAKISADHNERMPVTEKKGEKKAEAEAPAH